jgi:Tc5 transposase-like DNA-binding protein
VHGNIGSADIAANVSGRMNLTRPEEKALADWILAMQDVAMCVSTDVVKQKARLLMEQRGGAARTDDSSGSFGKKWLRGFLRRHPTIVRRRGEGLDRMRAAAASSDHVESFFEVRAHVRHPLHVDNEWLLIRDFRCCGDGGWWCADVEEVARRAQIRAHAHLEL